MTKVSITKELRGSILDIGGGGEGIIGRVYGSAVTSIDNLQEELEEAPNNCNKLLMNATELLFSEESFDNITFFYSLMYMDKATQQRAVEEAYRVLRHGGYLIIWDAVIHGAYPEPFLAEVIIDANGECVHTTYGIINDDAFQDSDTFIQLCTSKGLELLKNEFNNGMFKLIFVK